MKKVVMIDDDYSTEVLVEHLNFRGLKASRIASASEAYARLDEIVTADAIVLDIVMAAPDGKADGISGDRYTGMGILSEIRAKNVDVPILVFSGTHDVDLMTSISRQANTAFQSKWNSPSLQDFLEIVEGMLGVSLARPAKRPFIVHGHDDAEKLALKNFLQNTIGLPEPIILHEQPNLGRAIIEKFESFANETSFVFVLLTPDDVVGKVVGSNDEKRRSRQNVIFEMGYFLGAFGRDSGRVLLLHKGMTEMPSDLAGIVYIDISDGVVAAGEAIRKELTNVSR